MFLNILAFTGSIVPKCTGIAGAPKLPNGEYSCNFCDLVKLLDNIIKFMAGTSTIFVALFIIVGIFFIASSGGSESRLNYGRGIIRSAIIGFLIIISSWLLISSFFQVITSGNPTPWYEIKC